MEPEEPTTAVTQPGSAPEPQPAPRYDMNWVILGPDGLRAGWSILLFFFLGIACAIVYGLIVKSLFAPLHLTPTQGLSPLHSLQGELVSVLSLLTAAAISVRLEGRRLRQIYLDGPRPALHFLSGAVLGFAAVSAMVGVMNAGGWLSFGPRAISGVQIVYYGLLWAVAFLLVGCFEEGLFRGYFQFTLTRGLNLWWALAAVAALVLAVALNSKANGSGGVYLAAALGLGPALWVHRRKLPSNGFWQAAWVTSVTFGFIHTDNPGESWVGIFAAALIGFVFCVSIYVTGTLWWAIGCHAAWDWAQTFFYGTADSGLAATGHLLTTAPNGNPLLSGGVGGPEASLLVLPVILLLLAAVVLLGRRCAGSASVLR